MANYRLIKMNKKSALLHPVSTFYSDEYAEQTQDLFLRSEIVDHGYGKYTNAYRLYAKEHKLGLYKCPACDRAKGV